ncbi:putative kinesin [Pseudoneurospora amorphoporcata]|uniref:Kinesin n=1 Tax=Pseudoneurospora amorphoporcata TaxID=241081 RepID=A0AAN6SJ49_9PEZI|nr:putative kinesin [Pseudoneurospora amorphoporcata]
MDVASPPNSPGGSSLPQRPMSAMVRPAPRSSSRMSITSKTGGGSRASDDDVKTAVRVAVRVRPPLGPDDPGYDLVPQRFQRSMVQVQGETGVAIDSPQGRKLFVFDRVFGPEVDQEGVWEYLSDCVNAFTQGYNVSLLAYGQSGAGKSYTMGTAGPDVQEDLEAMGVIPRAAIALFEKLDGSSPKPQGGASKRASMSQLRAPSRATLQPSHIDKDWKLTATYVEIYNESLRDLLIPEQIPQHERGTVTIREDVKGNIILTGLQQIEVNSVDDLMNVLAQGSALRQTDATAINARSSRSHAVFSLNLVRKGAKGPAAPADRRMSMPLEAMSGTEAMVTTDSKMHFVDLAGSERLKNTGAQGDRAKEGISINAGLAALGKVISQLSSRQPGAHVSYRDSKLTRLLQDSLGGNAITYMIACVTQAEFHLSETLNTVQYAQRARAIQSKPRIQQVDDGDKQAIIERLKAEVAFLREQIRSSERGGGDRRSMLLAPGERSERQNEREAELQNQLLDARENYTTLSQRHAKLISEMAKARENEFAENQHLEESLDESATERLNRSNSFAQAVEQVVLEYEKTIQSLEQSLASTRATLANTETTLLEKETKCAYTETINTQLQARLQKLMDREASTENYLHDLEAKLDTHTSGEEKNATIITELRKEIARVRENEANAEDYISTLEERLAEADQDAELMQREIDRLEQVIERQRSLGKLDSLLNELDHIQQDPPTIPENEHELTNGARHRKSMASRDYASHSRSQSHVSHRSQFEEPIRESSEEDIPEEDEEDFVTPMENANHSTPKASHAQLAGKNGSKLVPVDKFETVTKELVELRTEHETTLHDYSALQAKHEEALRALAELQDAVDEARHPSRVRDSILSVSAPGTRPMSFVSGETKNGHRSLSSELSSALGSHTVVTDASDAETAKHHDSDIDEANADAQIQKLKSIVAAKEAAEKELAMRYAQLEEKHQETLDIVEELKTEIAKAQALNVDSSISRTSTPVIRRKSSQNVMIIDRAHRSFATLSNIASENLHDPDVMANFELNLNAAMHELHARSERIQELEADVATAKKEMETKMTIISGLTRERSSLKASSPMDMAMVSSLREQLERSEKQVQELRESNAIRQRELEAQISELQHALHQAGVDPAMVAPKMFDGDSDAQAKRILELEAELRGWEAKHKAALENLQDSEDRMKSSMAELGSQISFLTTQLTETETQSSMLSSRLAQTEGQVTSLNDQLTQNGHKEPEGDEAAKEKKHKELVEFLRREIDDYKELINRTQAKVTQAEEQAAATKALLDAATRERDDAAAEAEHNKQLLNQLEDSITEHEQTIKAHQESLHALELNHQLELEEARTASRREVEAEMKALKAEHAEKVRRLEEELTDAREDLLKVATQVAMALGLEVSIEKLSERIEDLLESRDVVDLEQKKRGELEQHVVELTSINDQVMDELESVKAALADMLVTENDKTRTLYPVKESVALVKKKMVDLETKNKKNSRLVEELEDQLQSNYDQVQITSNRLSTLQSEKTQQLEEANAAKIRLEEELKVAQEQYAALQAKYNVLSEQAASVPQRSDSKSAPNPSSPLRKSNSVQSLPSPPPAIPLPPLPADRASGAGSPTSGAPRPPSKDILAAALSNQQFQAIQEDQEARIRIIEKNLSAEKQLTATLEEALTDLETQQLKIKADADAWKRRASELEAELKELKDKPQVDNRWSLQQVEEERKKRVDAERARQHLEERMQSLAGKKKKKGSLNCF